MIIFFKLIGACAPPLISVDPPLYMGQMCNTYSVFSIIVNIKITRSQLENVKEKQQMVTITCGQYIIDYNIDKRNPLAVPLQQRLHLD